MRVESPPDLSAFLAATDTLERELAVVAGDAARIERACDELRQQRSCWRDPDCAPRLRALARPLKIGSGPARLPAVRLLLDAADDAADPWPVLLDLLSSSDPDVIRAALEYVRAGAERGTLSAAPSALSALGELVESGPDRLREADAIETAGLLMRGPPGGRTALVTLYLESPCLFTRRLAARALDLAPSPPSPSLATSVLGTALASGAAPYLGYTRATHLDLLDLAVTPDRGGLLRSLLEAERACGETLLREIIASIGWQALNAGLTVHRRIGMSVAGSFPLIVSPAEAAVLRGCRDVTAVFDRFIVIACGGSARPGGEPSSRDSINRFRAYNVRHADLLVELLDVAPLTAATIRRMVAQMDLLVEDFRALFPTIEGDAVAAAYGRVKAHIEAELSSAAGDRPPSASLTRAAQMFEDPGSPEEIHTLHGCKRYLHQRGLRLGFGLAEADGMTNRTVTIAMATPDRVLHVERPVEYVDFEPTGDGLPTVVRVAVDGFARHVLLGEERLPKLRVFCYENEVHCFAAFRNHPAFIRVDLSPPHRGGMIDLEYCGVSKYELDSHPNVALPAIEEIFRRAEFDVRIDNTRIHARYDKERAADLRDLSDTLERLFGLLPAFMDVDWLIGDLDYPEDARLAVAGAWADFFRGWGVLPMGRVLTADRRGILQGISPEPAGDRELRWPGTLPYRDCLTVPPPDGFWMSLRLALEARGLGRLAPFIGERPITQQALETYALGPLRRSLARGEIVETDDGYALTASDRYTARHEAAVLAEILSGGDEVVARSAHLARLAGVLEARLRFAPRGSVNGHDVQRAILPLVDGVIAICVLRDDAGIPRLAVFAPDTAVYERREGPDAAWEANWSCDPAALTAALRRHHFPDPWIEPESRPADAIAAAVRTLLAAGGGGRRPVAVRGERRLTGIKASPGRAVGLARLGLQGCRPSHVEGAILIAPSLAPADNPFVFRAGGIVSTGGGVLSHAGLMALAFRKPSIVVNGTWRRSLTGTESLAYGRAIQRDVHRRISGHDVVELHDTAEREEQIVDGDLLVVDADEGVLIVLGQEAETLALHGALRQLAEASRDLAAARTDAEVLSQRGRLLRALHQLEKLLDRIDEPALARHAADELLIGEAGMEAAIGQAEKVTLLRRLFANPASGAVARDIVRQLLGRIADGASAARDEAVRLIATAATPVEILSWRRRVHRTRQLLENVTTLLAASGLSGPSQAAAAVPDVDAAAFAGLSRLRIRAVAAARHAAAHGDYVRLRHVLRQLDLLDDVLSTPEAEREEASRMRQGLAQREALNLRAASGRRVIEPADGGTELIPLIGAKAAHLADADRLGAEPLIPRWFVVTDRAFNDVLDAPAGPAGTLREVIGQITARADLADAQKSRLIAGAWEAVRLPDALVADLASAYARLATPTSAPGAPADDDPSCPFVAVRSSASEEDTEAAARAGEFDTFLFVRGLPMLCSHLKRAWSGLWTERAMHNRAVFGAAGRIGGGVIVQRMAWARASGVLHTINLAAGRFREMVINAGLGLGEGVVSGAVAADQITVSKPEGLGASQLRFRYITNDKRERVVFDARFGSGTMLAGTLYHQRLRPALEYVELAEIVKAAARLEWAFRQPLDIEFALEGPHLRLLQLRPIPAVHALWRDTRDGRSLTRRTS